MDDLMRWLRQRFCKHLFVGLDLQGRDLTGRVTWPCSKCGKVFRAECGLDVLQHGDVKGPWYRR